MDQQVNVKFCVRLGKTPLETCQLLHEVYGNQALSQTAVQEIYRSLGEADAEDDETIQIRDMLKRQPTSGPDLIGNLVGLTTERVYSIATEKLQLRQVCNRLVPSVLSESDRRARLAFCRDLTMTTGNESRFLESLVIGGLVWCSELNLPPLPLEDDPNVIRPYPGHWLCTRLVVFFDSQGIIWREFVPMGIALNPEYQAALMRRLCGRIEELRPQFNSAYSWSLLYDADSLGRRFVPVCRYLSRKNVTLIDLPAHSPDLTPSEFFLFPKLKQIMNVTDNFEKMREVQKAVKQALRSIPEEEFGRSYSKLIERCGDCSAVEGQYFRR